MNYHYSNKADKFVKNLKKYIEDSFIKLAKRNLRVNAFRIKCSKDKKCFNFDESPTDSYRIVYMKNNKIYELLKIKDFGKFVPHISLAKVQHNHDQNALWAENYGKIIEKRVWNVTRHSFICTNNKCIDI